MINVHRVVAPASSPAESCARRGSPVVSSRPSSSRVTSMSSPGSCRRHHHPRLARPSSHRPRTTSPPPAVRPRARPPRTRPFAAVGRPSARAGGAPTRRRDPPRSSRPYTRPRDATGRPPLPRAGADVERLISTSLIEPTGIRAVDERREMVFSCRPGTVDLSTATRAAGSCLPWNKLDERPPRCDNRPGSLSRS